MRKLLSLIIVVAAAGWSMAQERPTALQAAVSFLNFKAVQTDLKLTAAQIKSIDSYRNQVTDLMKSLQNSKTPPTKAQADAAGTKVKGLVDKALNVLNANQQMRLRQLVMQRYGIFSIVAKDIKGLIGLSADQEKKVRSIQESADKKVADLVQQRQMQLRSIPQPKDPNNSAQAAAYQKKVRETAESFEKQDKKTIEGWQKSAEAQALAVLTPAQKTKWQQAQGPKFDFSKLK